MDWSLIGELMWANFVTLTVLMLGTWLYCLITKQDGLFDVAWPGGFLVVGITSFSACQGLFLRKLLVFVMLSLWACRLGAMFIKRLSKKEPQGTSQAAKESFWPSLGVDSQVKFALLFLLQGILILVVSWPIVLASSNSLHGFSKIELFGCLIWLIAFLGEYLADKQLRAFRAVPENRLKVCDAGLWGYSRHPNYFFEWLIWVGFFLLALDAPLGSSAIVSPVLMWYLLRHISGVTIVEKHELATKGDEYRKYQGKVSSFVPWFRKS